MTILSDTYGRRFEKLRVSLTNQCNFNCVYCVGKEHVPGQMIQSARSVQQSESSLQLKDYQAIISKIHQISPLKQIRFTGGEPMLSPHLISLIGFSKDLGIKNVGITTNGWYLERKMKELIDLKIVSLNISLDGISNEFITRMAGHSQAYKVKETIELAVSAGLPVKLNAVIMKGKNEQEILPLLEYARNLNIPVRFIEFMAMGHLHHTKSNYLFSQNEILDTIAARYNFTYIPRTKSSTSEYWRLSSGDTFGIIANYTTPFCHDCNRLRLDSTGKLFGCLSSTQSISLKSRIADDELFKQALAEALGHKQQIQFTGSALSMKYIGG
nr:GTP 3',8-cyclase MoaA [uncultured Carboxylicivirga sp.]